MKLLLCASLFLLCHCILAQDEKAFRDLLTDKRIKEDEESRKDDYRFMARGHRYYLDLDGDERSESFFVSKRDGGDWIEFFNHKEEKIFDFRFDTAGSWSRVFKVQLRKISATSKVLMIYFYEGVTRYVNFEGTSRLYMMTWENDDLSTLSMYKGPYLWNEKRTFRNQYQQRKFEVSMFDFDADFEREVAVRYGSITRVYKYLGKGRWNTYSP